MIEPLVTHEMRIRDLQSMASILRYQAQDHRRHADTCDQMARSLEHYAEFWKERDE